MDMAMLVLGFFAGIAFGADLGFGISHRREVEKRKEAEAQVLSGLEHEAYLRAELNRLYQDNEYLRNKNERRKLYAADASDSSRCATN